MADTLQHPAVVTAVQTCESCPDQWEGTVRGGRAFYFRFRHGRASLAIGPDAATVAGVCSPVGLPDGVAYAQVGHGGHLDGSFGTDRERHDVFARLYDLIGELR